VENLSYCEFILTLSQLFLDERETLQQQTNLLLIVTYLEHQDQQVLNLRQHKGTIQPNLQLDLNSLKSGENSSFGFIIVMYCYCTS